MVVMVTVYYHCDTVHTLLHSCNGLSVICRW